MSCPTSESTAGYFVEKTTQTEIKFIPFEGITFRDEVFEPEISRTVGESVKQRAKGQAIYVKIVSILILFK